MHHKLYKLTVNNISITRVDIRWLTPYGFDPTIREWDTKDMSTWRQVGDPCAHQYINLNAIAVNPIGILVTSTSYDNHVRLLRLTGRQNIAIFQHFDWVKCVTFSTDGT